MFSPRPLEAPQEPCVFLLGHGLSWTQARGGKDWESIARCQEHLSSWAGTTAAQTAWSWLCPPVPIPPPAPASPPSRLAQVWCICGLLAALTPAVRGSCQVKSWLARLDPTCELFYFPSLPYTASVCFYKYFTSLAKVYFISLLNLLNINAATTLP